MSDIAELFSRDPLDLTDIDIVKVIDFYRQSRANFTLAGPAKRGKPAAEPAAKLSLDNLELDI